VLYNEYFDKPVSSDDSTAYFVVAAVSGFLPVCGAGEVFSRCFRSTVGKSFRSLLLKGMGAYEVDGVC
jgi:hypothetical protein